MVDEGGSGCEMGCSSTTGIAAVIGYLWVGWAGMRKQYVHESPSEGAACSCSVRSNHQFIAHLVMVPSWWLVSMKVPMPGMSLSSPAVTARESDDTARVKK